MCTARLLHRGPGRRRGGGAGAGSSVGWPPSSGIAPRPESWSPLATLWRPGSRASGPCRRRPPSALRQRWFAASGRWAGTAASGKLLAGRGLRAPVHGRPTPAEAHPSHRRAGLDPRRSPPHWPPPVPGAGHAAAGCAGHSRSARSSRQSSLSRAAVAAFTAGSGDRPAGVAAPEPPLGAADSGAKGTRQPPQPFMFFPQLSVTATRPRPPMPQPTYAQRLLTFRLAARASLSSMKSLAAGPTY